MRDVCEIMEIFKNIYFEEHLWTTASAFQVVLKILVTSQENTCVGVSFLKSYRLKACNFIKKSNGNLTKFYETEFSWEQKKKM